MSNYMKAKGGHDYGILLFSQDQKIEDVFFGNEDDIALALMDLITFLFMQICILIVEGSSQVGLAVMHK